MKQIQDRTSQWPETYKSIRPLVNLGMIRRKNKDRMTKKKKLTTCVK